MGDSHGMPRDALVAGAKETVKNRAQQATPQNRNMPIGTRALVRKHTQLSVDVVCQKERRVETLGRLRPLGPLRSASVGIVRQSEPNTRFLPEAEFVRGSGPVIPRHNTPPLQARCITYKLSPEHAK